MSKGYGVSKREVVNLYMMLGLSSEMNQDKQLVEGLFSTILLS